MIVSGPGIGGTTPLRQRETVLGRGEDCHLQIRDDSISRRHAMVTSILDRWLAIDLGSTNGTFINDTRIERAELKDGDLLRIGKVVLKLTTDRHEQEYLKQALELANTDALTGLYNRRHFDETLAAELPKPGGAGGQCALILFDVDHFKAVNDEYGHRTGDAVLKHLAFVTKARLTQGQSLFRTGGEEFAILLANTSQSLARVSAEQLRRAVEHTTFNIDGLRIAVTVSVGVAGFEAGDRASDLYQRADRLLYAAKHGGRNRVA